MNEIWMPVKGYEGLYEISNLGRVKSLERRVYNPAVLGDGNTRKVPERIRKHNIQHGYHCVALITDHKTKVFRVHRLVAEHFIGPQPTPEHQVNHIDGNKANNCVDNLEWVTPKENTQHAIQMGLRESSFSEDRRKMISEKSKQNWQNDDYRKAQKERMLLNWQNPDYREKILSNMRGKKRTPEQIERYKAVPERTTPVINITTGKIYESARIAAEEYGVTPEAIRACINGSSKSCCKCIWRYYDGK